MQSHLILANVASSWVQLCSQASAEMSALEWISALTAELERPSSLPCEKRARSHQLSEQRLLPLQGSGKTLAFGLPILQLLHSEALAAGSGALSADPGQTGAEPDAEAEQPQGASEKLGQCPLRALILEPTRELAMQAGPPLNASPGTQCAASHNSCHGTPRSHDSCSSVALGLGWIQSFMIGRECT